jgi:serine/threonine protein kinase
LVQDQEASLQDLADRALGKYIILEEIGRGGMGAVYKARDVELDRIVAIKILSPYLIGEPRLVQRFIREARLAASLDHPNIVTIYDIGGEGGYYYFAMKFLEGRPLKQYLTEEGPLPLDQAASIASQLASALDYAHEQNLIHRDVKPGNVIINDSGHASLTDFGLAKVAESLKLTASGEAMGTLEYMAPEQARGDVRRESDIYSLGVMVYEMLTGRLPFQGTNQATLLYQHMHDPPPPVRQWRPDVPPEIEQVILKAMAKLPEDRYQKAGEMARELEEIAGKAWFPPPAKKPAKKEPAAKAKPVSKRPRRKRPRARSVLLLPALSFLRQWGWVMLGAVAFVSVLIAGLIIVRNRPRPTTPAPAQTGLANANFLPVVNIRPPVPTPVPIVMQEPLAIRCSAGGVGDAGQLALWKWGQEEPIPWPGLSEDLRPSQAFWSPDGNTIVFTVAQDEQTDLYRIDFDGTDLRQLTSTPEEEKDPVWNPWGDTITFAAYYEGNWEIYSMPSEGGEPQNISQHPADDWSPAWSPDGRWIAFVSDREGNPDIYLLDLSSGAVTQLTTDKARDLHPIWSPTESRMIFLSDREGAFHLYHVDLLDLQQKSLLVEQVLWEERPTWSPEGDWLAFTQRDSSGAPQITLFDLEEGQAYTGPVGCFEPAWRPVP